MRKTERERERIGRRGPEEDWIRKGENGNDSPKNRNMGGGSMEIREILSS